VDHIQKSNNFRKFLILWSGELIANVGSGISAFGLSVYVFQLTGRATDVAMVMLFAFLPPLIVMPFGGVLADRFDRRVLMILGDGCSVIGLLVMFFIILSGNIEVWQICVCVAASSAFTGLLSPAFKATITDLLSEEQFSRGSGLMQLAGAAKFLLAPALAGILLSVTDIKTLLLIDICTIFYTLPVAMFIKRTLGKSKLKPAGEKMFTNFIDGWKYVATNKGLLNLIILLALLNFFIGLLQTLFTPMVLAFSDPKTLGLIQTIGATGMLVGSAVLGFVSIRSKYVRIMFLSLCLTGVSTMLIGTTISPIILTMFVFMFFLMIPALETCIDVMMRKSTSNELQGRVWGFSAFITQLGYIIAYGLSGILADYIFNPLLVEGGALASTVGSIIGTGQGRGIGFQFVISGVLIVVIAIIIHRNKSIREMDKRCSTDTSDNQGE
jgi:MFS family permease